MNLICWTTGTLLLLASSSFAKPLQEERVRYDNDIVVRVKPSSVGHLHFLRKLAFNGEPGVDFWTFPTRVAHPVDVHLSVAVSEEFLKKLVERGMRYRITIPNLQTLIDNESRSRRKKRHAHNFFDDFRSHLEIINWINDTVDSEACSDLCSSEVIGLSYERREIKVLKVGYPGENKPILWIDGGIHAREWIAPSTAMYIAHKLIENRNEQQIQTLLDTFDFYIVPLVNPDGYVYSFRHRRMWRKTRSRNRGSDCVGTDPNRNFNFHHAEVGSDNSPCSETYHGPRPFSEPETAALSGYILSKGERPRGESRIKLYLALHSYGKYWLTPWGWTRELPSDYDELVEKANRAVEALKQHRGKRYFVGTAARTLYQSSGGADDWAKGVAKVPYSYTVELPGDDNKGFLVETSEIIPTGEETFAAVIALGATLDGVYRTGP